ncbi:MAG: hypothetical protein M1816_008173 [Peltula sp. TS41687]|nr:MAG: hypothetical protein M1816_008173 [Peltula sp. TS41687]
MTHRPNCQTLGLETPCCTKDVENGDRAVQRHLYYFTCAKLRQVIEQVQRKIEDSLNDSTTCTRCSSDYDASADPACTAFQAASRPANALITPPKLPVSATSYRVLYYEEDEQESKFQISLLILKREGYGADSKKVEHLGRECEDAKAIERLEQTNIKKKLRNHAQEALNGVSKRAEDNGVTMNGSNSSWLNIAALAKAHGRAENRFNSERTQSSVTEA